MSACLKHFVCNDQEHDRYEIDVAVDERTLREIYLEPFRIAIEAASPWAVMSAYNSVNGTTASENLLLDDILRDEFGFDGVVVSDWYGTYSRGVVTSGLDLEMPGPGRWLGADEVQSAIDSGNASEEAIDLKVARLLTLMERTAASERQGVEAKADEPPASRALARRVAANSMVLLTNNGLLPLDSASGQQIAVIGELARSTPHQGGGSSTVNPHRVVSILEGIESAVADNAVITWTPGCGVRQGPPPIEPTSLADALVVQYFSNPDLAGDPVRTVSTDRSYLAFFGTGDEWVDYDKFSVRISGQFVAQASGAHHFGFSAGGRLRVRFNDDVVVDEWAGDPQKDADVDIELDEGDAIDIVIEFSSMPGERWRWLGIGCTPPGPEVSISSAVAAASEADLAVVVVGLNDQLEGEGFDRPNLKLPGQQDDLIAAVIDAQPNTVVVVTAGAAVEMPWHDKASAVMFAWYGGQEIGHALADVLFGLTDPGGRLPITLPADSRQHPGLLNYPGENGIVRYGEGVYVGYRGYDRLGLQPMFAFGHGLSYSTFQAEVLGCISTGDEVSVEIELANVGDRDGVEVVQVFAHDIADVDRRLVAFEKVHLPKGESMGLTVTFPTTRLRSWDPTASDWKMPEGTISLSVSGSFGTTTTSLTASQSDSALLTPSAHSSIIAANEGPYPESPAQ